MKRRPDPLLDDPVVSEVRRWRAALQREAGGTLEGLIRLINERAAARAAAKKPRSLKRSGNSPQKSTPAKRRKRAA